MADRRPVPSPYHPLRPASIRLVEVFDRSGVPDYIRDRLAPFRERGNGGHRRMVAMEEFVDLVDRSASWVTRQDAITLDAAELAAARSRHMASVS